jgi:hypothetical protein
MTIIVPRSAWGAKKAEPGGNRFKPPILGMAVHWEDRTPQENHDKCDDEVRWVQAFHMGPERGWNDIAYNAIACNHGRLYQGRIGGCAANGSNFGNDHFPAVCWLGKPGYQPTDAALAAIHDAKEYLHIPADGPVYPHNHFWPTACPGPYLTAWCKAGAHDPTKPKPPPDPRHYLVTYVDGTGATVSRWKSAQEYDDFTRKVRDDHKDDTVPWPWSSIFDPVGEP